METLIKLLRIPLNITGFDILSETLTIWHTIRRIFFFVSATTLVCLFTLSLCFDQIITVSDKIFLFIGLIAFVAIMIQGIHFWHHKDKVKLIVTQVKKMYETRDESWIQNDAKPLFEKCFGIIKKLWRYVLESSNPVS